MPFEQYERHTAWVRAGGVANRSGAGDRDVIVYAACKWARPALDGNPTVLLALFVPDAEVVFRDQLEADLVAACASSEVPDEPDRAWVDGWLHRTQLTYWHSDG